MKGSQSREVDGILLHTIIKLFSGLLLLMYYELEEVYWKK